METIRKTLDFLFDDGDVFEVCLIGVSINKHKLWGNEYAGKGAVIAGWFNDKDKAVSIIKQVEKEVCPTGVYTTLNPCNEALLGRANNRLKVVKSRTSDKEIESINHVLIDVDPKRPSGVSSSDPEIKLAADLANKIYKDLSDRDWPLPLCAVSGNGYHFIYKAKDAYPELIKGFLNGLSSRYSNDLVDVDTTVFNPARLVKIYGTTARKGEDIKTRPHRMSSIKSLPEEIIHVDADYLAALAIPEEPKKKKSTTNYDGDSLDVRQYLADYGVECIGEKQHGSAILYLLQNCIFDETHANNEAAIGQGGDGKLFYQCFHNSCKSMTWHDARQIISGSDKIVSKVSKGSKVSKISDCQQNVSKRAAPGQHLVSSCQAPDELYGDIKDWISKRHGIFSTYDIDQEFGLRSREEKNVRSKVLNNLKKQGVVDHNGVKRGQWRTRDNDLEIMDVFGAAQTSVTVPFPLGISELVKIYTKSIVLIAGEANSGKSAYVSNLLYNIYNKKEVVHKLKAELGIDEDLESWYFNSEMSAEELKERWSNFDDINVFRNVNVVSRSSNFHDVIRPNGINVIDYLEIYDNFWEIGGWIKQIYEKLDRGIAVICIQKKSGGDIGRGGEITLEKPRLYIALKDNKPHGGICKIVKAKAFIDPSSNPNGKELDYKLISGSEFIETSEWRHVTDKEREKINANKEMDDMCGADGIIYNVPLKCGGVGGLKRNTYDTWDKSYPDVCVMTELKKYSQGNHWLTKQNWFFQLSSILSKAQSEQSAAG